MQWGNLLAIGPYGQTMRWANKVINRGNEENEEKVELTPEQYREREEQWREEKRQFQIKQEREAKELLERKKKIRPYFEQAECWREQGLCYFCGGQFGRFKYNRYFPWRGIAYRRDSIVSTLLGIGKGNFYKCKSCKNFVRIESFEQSILNWCELDGYPGRYELPPLREHIEEISGIEIGSITEKVCELGK